MDFQRRGSDADKVFGVGIERIGGQRARGGIEDELNIELMVPERTETAAVRSGVYVRMFGAMVVIVTSVVVVGVLLGATSQDRCQCENERG